MVAKKAIGNSGCFDFYLNKYLKEVGTSLHLKKFNNILKVTQTDFPQEVKNIEFLILI